MSKTVTFRLDRETSRILKDLAERENGSKTKAIKRALREHWRGASTERQPTAWEVYSAQRIPPARPHLDRARNVGKILRQILLEKKRNGTL